MIYQRLSHKHILLHALCFVRKQFTNAQTTIKYQSLVQVSQNGPADELSESWSTAVPTVKSTMHKTLISELDEMSSRSTESSSAWSRVYLGDIEASYGLVLSKIKQLIAGVHC
jgi:hypothetical protein